MNVALVFWLANVMSQVLDSTLSPSDAVFGSSAAHAHASLKAPGTAGDFKEPMLRCSVFSHEPAEVVNQNKIRHARIYHEYIIYRTLFRSDIVAWQVCGSHHLRVLCSLRVGLETQGDSNQPQRTHLDRLAARCGFT